MKLYDEYCEFVITVEKLGFKYNDFIFPEWVKREVALDSLLKDFDMRTMMHSLPGSHKNKLYSALAKFLLAIKNCTERKLDMIAVEPNVFQELKKADLVDTEEFVMLLASSAGIHIDDLVVAGTKIFSGRF